MMKENTKKVFSYLKSVNGEQVTAADVAEALGLEKRTVDGIFTSAIQRKGFGVRTPAEVEVDDGTHKAVKFLSLTDAGLAYDPEAEEAAAKEAKERETAEKARAREEAKAAKKAAAED